MLKLSALRLPRKSGLASFTLVELLIVMGIMAVLLTMIIYAASGVLRKASRSRAAGEIVTMTSALDSYKLDNGYYPTASGLLTNSAAAPYFSTTLDGSSTAYITNCETLYMALAGQTNASSVPNSAGKSYMTFKNSQLGNPLAVATAVPPNSTYIKDPWGSSYGYSTGTATSYPVNGIGLFDLWSTGGVKSSVVGNTNTWVGNWRN